MINKKLQEPTMPAFSFRLVSKVLLIVGFVIVGCIALINFFFLDKIAETNVRQIKEMAGATALVVSDLAVSSFYSRDKTQIIDALDKVWEEDASHESGLQQISVILLPSGVYYASTNREFQNKKVGQTLLKKIELNSGNQTISEMLNYEVNNRTTTVLQFLRNININMDGEEKRIATVQILFDFNKILKKSRELLFIIGGLILLLCFILVCLIYLPISSVYRKLYEGMEAVARDQFDFKLLSRTRDETGILFRAFNRMNHQLLQNFRKRQDAHLEVLKEKERPAIQAEHLLRKTEITCLCARIPGIQEVIESSASSVVDEYVADFIEPFEKVVKEYGGQVVKILGDKVYTLFEGINSIDNSVRTALKINQSWQVANHERMVLNRKQKNYGIGLHSTEGIAGSLSAMSGGYTFVGEAASVAERLCSSAQVEEILISASMMDKTSGAYLHQVLKTVSGEDLTIKEDIISITPLPMDEAHSRYLLKTTTAAGRQNDRLDGSESMMGKKKPSFESSITDMLEETLIISPLDPLKTVSIEDPEFQNGYSASNTREDSSDDGSSSLWSEFDAVKKGDK
ncbi:hypothetical protein KKI24_20305 [bacterium]|nr:hypothetical protein [bacterium]